MSFTSFKQTLKRCSDFPNPSSSQPSILNEDLKSPQLPRKPPKSSLSQQLQRLQDPLSLPPPKQNQEQPVKENAQEVDDDDDGDAEESGIGISREPVSTHFQFDPTGPFEPMVLSSPGESPVVQVPAAINCRLLEHQREGVRFLYGLYKKNHGGILGDDMGLGKTIQTIAFLAAVVGDEAENGDSKMLKRVGKKNPVLIICPTSIIQNWENEFSKWAKFSVSVYHGANRDLIIEKLESHGIDVVITSFDSFRIHGKILSEVDWHIVVVDEAHRLKNDKSKLYGACLGIKTRNRYGLTGTVMQNKIMELFNLFDWVAPGSLGTREHFRDFYDEPLKLGQRSSAPERFVQVADERKQHLASVLRRYLLRRTKEETIGHLMMARKIMLCFVQ
ncbi:hypothetical protein C5167_009043 [Papaver somniferum]|uniref:Helicase ATP-binding domain-containing protein n=1 Tax=Papaver somniferum TaxID=3469 RepID=A0A4Y7K086_PAPSO|nr:hypothetical protein C5167_009043 [Papaver somniferum]